VNARGDAVVAWATPRGAARATVRVALRSQSGRLTRHRIWSSRGLTVDGISVVIDRRGEVTVAWSSTAGPGGHGDTVRATYRSHGGRWATVRVVGHSFDEPLPPERQPRLAVAPDGRVLLSWDARRHPFSAPGRPTVAWRDRGHRFGAAHALRGAPSGLGPIPAFDAKGRAYVFGRCAGVVLSTAPGGERFQPPIVLAKHALGFELALGRSGEGLATWVAGRCTSDPSAGSTLGPVRASVLHRGSFGAALALTGAAAQAADTTAAARPEGGGYASWAELAGSFSALIAPDGTIRGTHAVPGGLVPHAFTRAGDQILTGQTTFPTSVVQGGVQVVPAGSSSAEAAPTTFGRLAVASPTGRAAAIVWGALDLSVWRP
jgi:hypothetical protein